MSEGPHRGLSGLASALWIRGRERRSDAPFVANGLSIAEALRPCCQDGQSTGTRRPGQLLRCSVFNVEAGYRLNNFAATAGEWSHLGSISFSRTARLLLQLLPRNCRLQIEMCYTQVMYGCEVLRSFAVSFPNASEKRTSSGAFLRSSSTSARTAGSWDTIGRR